jgi:hypothetical protein
MELGTCLLILSALYILVNNHHDLGKMTFGYQINLDQEYLIRWDLGQDLRFYSIK